jgi:periplasmic protein TonB
MSPKALIFSSDQETSRLVDQALSEFGFEVEACVEIFAAVERLTSGGYQVIAADWDDGVEASFLLKTARELKANADAFTIALAKPEMADAAKRAGANFMLKKPILPGQPRQTLMGCQEFTVRFKGAQLIPTESVQVANPYNQLINPPEMPSPTKVAPAFLKTNPLPPSPTPKVEVETSLEADVVAIGEHLHAAPQDVPVSGEQLRRSSIQTLFSNAPQVVSHKPGIKLDLKKFWRGSVYGFFLLACGLFVYGPVRTGALSVTAQSFWKATRETVQSTFAPSPKDPILAPVPPLNFNPSLLPDRVERISVDTTPQSDSMIPEVNMAFSPVHPLEALAQIDPLPVMPQLQAQSTPLQPSPRVLYESVPQSLRTAPQAVTVRDSGLKPSPSLLSILEPVKVDEGVADKLIVHKVSPVYPDQALRTGMQGTVVLQALISREGAVEDLKLVDGSLILGEAAVTAVRQWHYQPYFVNGRPVQTQTQVTVEFKLPAVASAIAKP